MTVKVKALEHRASGRIPGKTKAPGKTPCSISAIRDEVCDLVCRGAVDPHQPIYSLCRYYCDRDWQQIEIELERNDYLIRDRIGELVGDDAWRED